MRVVVSLSLFLIACGGDHATPPDAPATDAPADTLPAGCDYAEQRDLTNDDVDPATGTPEPVGTFATRTVVCGSFASDHFDGDITVDIDGYVLALAADADVLVRIFGAGAGAVELVGVDIYGGSSFDQLVGSNTFYGDHGVTAVHLPAGSYELAAFALHGEAIAAPIDYRLEIVVDSPATRCVPLVAGGYAESADGGSSTGNDMVTIPSGAPPALTATADAPEPTGIVIASSGSQRLTGSLADVATADQYEDKDTFAVTTGATTNELAVHLSWPGVANLDYLVFEDGSPDPVNRAVGSATQGPELDTFPVKPGAAYWLLIGAKVGSTGFPIPYSATLCGASASLAP